MVEENKEVSPEMPQLSTEERLKQENGVLSSTLESLSFFTDSARYNSTIYQGISVILKNLQDINAKLDKLLETKGEVVK